MTGLLTKCRDMIVSLDKSTRKKLGSIHDLVDGLCSDRSDRSVLTQGVEGLWKSNFDIKKMPASVTYAVERIINKFSMLNFK